MTPTRHTHPVSRGRIVRWMPERTGAAGEAVVPGPGRDRIAGEGFGAAALRIGGQTGFGPGFGTLPDRPAPCACRNWRADRAPRGFRPGPPRMRR